MPQGYRQADSVLHLNGLRQEKGRARSEAIAHLACARSMQVVLAREGCRCDLTGHPREDESTFYVQTLDPPSSVIAVDSCACPQTVRATSESKCVNACTPATKMVSSLFEAEQHGTRRGCQISLHLRRAVSFLAERKPEWLDRLQGAAVWAPRHREHFEPLGGRPIWLPRHQR